MGLAFRCNICSKDPMWRIERHGDAVVSWACTDHLSQESENLQRYWEITELSVFLSSKLREYAEIQQSLREIINAERD